MQYIHCIYCTTSSAVRGAALETGGCHGPAPLLVSFPHFGKSLLTLPNVLNFTTHNTLYTLYSLNILILHMIIHIHHQQSIHKNCRFNLFLIVIFILYIFYFCFSLYILLKSENWSLGLIKYLSETKQKKTL